MLLRPRYHTPVSARGIAGSRILPGETLAVRGEMTCTGMIMWFPGGPDSRSK